MEDLAVFQPYRDLEAGDNQSLKIQVARPGIEPRTSCSASQELNHSTTAAPTAHWITCQVKLWFMKDSIAKTENEIMLPDKVQYLPETDMNMHIPAAKHKYVP